MEQDNTTLSTQIFFESFKTETEAERPLRRMERMKLFTIDLALTWICL